MTGGRRIHGKKNCFGRNWCVFDACGIVCAAFTWFLLLYGQFCVLCVMMLGSLADDPIHQSINFLLFELLFFLSGAAHLKTMFTDPGAVPKGTLTKEYIAHLEREQQNYGTVLYKCTKCSCLRPERAHHCSVCQRCIRKALQDEYHFLKRMDDEEEQHSSRSSSWKNLQVVFGKPPKPLLLLTNRAGTVTVLLLLSAFVYAALVISHIGELEGNGKVGPIFKRFTSQGCDIREYIVNCLVEMGIEVAKQPFKPVSSSLLKANSSASRENVYGIVRTLRAIPAESILLAVPMRSSKIEPIAVALAFADYAKKQSYWARDLIFLFVDGGEKVAAEAWFSEYHGHRHPFIQSSDGEAGSRLEIHGGQIVGAFALDFSGSLLSHIDVQYSMVNNKLSNLDLVNLCVLLVEKAGSVTSIHGKQFYVAFWRNANHAKNNEEKRHSTIIDLEDTVRLIEGAMRSLNNLLEKLHHSYLLYVLTSPHRFVSVAFYMPLMGFLLTPLLILALREWLRMGGADNLALVGPSLVRMVYAPMVALAFYGLQFVLYADPRFPAKALAIPLTLLLPLLISGAFFLVPISSSSANIHFARFVIAIELSLFL
uniref:Glycosylphosphatidylinositol anchor attachment 1 protein n=1 Tax=Globodera pallida TaxID=36090 RepID=A0A183CKR0_GLOPA